MSLYVKLGITTLLALAMVAGAAWADQAFAQIGDQSLVRVQIDDLSGTPSVSTLGGLIFIPPPPTILSDSTGEFLHFTLQRGSFSTISQALSMDLFEDVVGGTVSDRLLVTETIGSSDIDVRFASDPAAITLPPGVSTFP